MEKPNLNLYEKIIYKAQDIKNRYFSINQHNIPITKNYAKNIMLSYYYSKTIDTNETNLKFNASKNYFNVLSSGTVSVLASCI